ncbi:MAG: helix-turn-helix domain-containing protein [Gammaproteobacteria bacterium]|nr:helix-turn-helix domain-containing protein [Gammaproteobacteria bacterium]
MSIKAKASTKKAAPAKAPTKAKPTKATPAEAPENAIKVLKKGSCPSLSDTGMLSYEVGADDSGETYYRITANNAGGFFSKEWVAWSKIYAACNQCDWLTSIHLRSLFNGKSVNTAGFLLAALKDQGLIQRREGKSRHYVLTDKARKAATPV